MPDIFADDFAILVDHIERENEQVFVTALEEKFNKATISYVKCNFPCFGRDVCVLASESWKYVKEM